MRIYRPNLLTVGGVKYEIHFDRTVYRRAGSLRRVKDPAEVRRVIEALAAQIRPLAVAKPVAPTPAKSPS